MQVKYFTLNILMQVTAEELTMLPKSYNPFYELTGGVIFLDEFPQTTSEKIHFKKMKSMANDYVQSLQV